MRKAFVVIFTAVIFLFTASSVLAEEQSLQDLIDQADEGDTLELEAKVYAGNVVINKPLTIIGQEGTIIKGDQTGNVVEIESHDVTLDHMEVTGSGMSRDSREEHSAVRVMGNNTVLNNLTIKESFHGVLLNRIDNTTMSNLTIIGSESTNLS